MTENGYGKKEAIIEAAIKFTSELIGTGGLMVYGCGGVIHTRSSENSFLQSGLNFGFAVLIIVMALGHVSGAHINPCITIAAFILRKITWIETLYYMVAQFFGAILGYGLLIILFPEEARYGLNNDEWSLCVTKVNKDLNVVQGLFIEIFLTGGLVAATCGLWDARNATQQDSASLKVAILVSSLSLIGGKWTGASMNPPRSFAPALFAGNFENHWIYWVGPPTGAVGAAFFYKYVIYWKINTNQIFVNTIAQ